ncbi:DNA-directed RNA polymerase sigma-70 factor [Bacteroidia bacterium]|nr:DNA-directed RNA polymerase sigma-70 factor [Bacteroidia bacterium]
MQYFPEFHNKDNIFLYFCEKSHLLRRKNISVLSDEDILSRYKDSGNTEYFGELYNRYIPLLYGIGLKYLNDAGNAEDAVMQLFEHLLPKITQYDISVFRTWIYSVMKNHCLQILRKENQEIIVDFNTEIMESDEILHLFDEDNNDNTRKDLLKRCIKKLPVEQRIAIIRFFMEEMSYADIVDGTEYNLKQVKSYIQNGKRNLKICIEKNGQ